MGWEHQRLCAQPRHLQVPRLEGEVFRRRRPGGVLRDGGPSPEREPQDPGRLRDHPQQGRRGHGIPVVHHSEVLQAAGRGLLHSGPPLREPRQVRHGGGSAHHEAVLPHGEGLPGPEHLRWPEVIRGPPLQGFHGDRQAPDHGLPDQGLQGHLVQAFPGRVRPHARPALLGRLRPVRREEGTDSEAPSKLLQGPVQGRDEWNNHHGVLLEDDFLAAGRQDEGPQGGRVQGDEACRLEPRPPTEVEVLGPHILYSP
mmetsp:Transcript_115166/g.306195  ORF Transcript_115166/g.306195 Transcript_115166/m.306195 type:complete len:255 (-) Transcript_115166:29-793(-)